MVKRINKKVALKLSAIISSIVGVLFFGFKGTTPTPIEQVLQAPILSIERASADGAGGDCCCSSTDGGSWPSEPASSGALIWFTEP